MTLLDRVRSAASGASSYASAGPSLPARGFDHVEVPAGHAGRTRFTKREFEALPLGERVSLLVQGTLRFYRDDREVAASEAMRAAF